MGFQVSPGVEVKEIDLTNVIPAVSTSIGGFSGYFKWGPINEISLLSSEKALLQKFGTPDSSVLYADPFFQAASFLEYGDAIKVVRAGNLENFSNATDNGGADKYQVSSVGGTGTLEPNTYTVGVGSSGQSLTFTKANDGAITIGTNVQFDDELTATASANLTATVSDIGKSIVSVNGLVENGSSLPDGQYTNDFNSQLLTFTKSGGALTIDTNVTGLLPADRPGSFIVQYTQNTPQVGTAQVGTAQVGTAQVGTAASADFVPASADFVAASADFVAASADFQAQVGVPGDADYQAQVGTAQVGTAQVGTAQVGTAASADFAAASVDFVAASADFVPASADFAAAFDTIIDVTITVTYTALTSTVNLAYDGVTDNGVWIPNETYFEDSFTAPQGGTFAARYAGGAGNGLKVYALTAANYSFIEEKINASPVVAGTFTTEEESVYNSFDLAPDAKGTNGALEDEVHVAIIDTLGTFGVAGSIVEKFAGLSLSKTSKTEAGATNYIKNVINTKSRYVYLIKGDNSDFTQADFAGTSEGEYTLSGGLEAGMTAADGTEITEGLKELDIRNGLDLLGDVETVDVNLLFSQIAASGAGLQNHAHKIAYQRKDAVAFMSPPKAATVGASTPLADVIAFGNTIVNRGVEGSYGVIDSGAVYIYDRYNDVYRFIPANGHLAGLCANTDDVAEPWFSPAGFNRGGFRSIVKLAFNPMKAQRDELYKVGINPIASFPGQGTVLFGDKTAQSKPSAFDRINVRRLFIVLEKAIATAAKFQLFELNDEFTRATFRNAVEPFLRDVQGRRGITDFMVVCDDTNNTGEVIDTNRFVADIYIKPARSINFITLNFIATRTGVDFSEVAGLSNA